jgi:hypothetical protein
VEANQYLASTYLNISVIQPSATSFRGSESLNATEMIFCVSLFVGLFAQQALTIPLQFEEQSESCTNLRIRKEWYEKYFSLAKYDQV